MENFNLLDGSDTLKASRDTINNNLLSVRSLSSGTAFPTDNLSVGMLCYRTDLKRLYQYQENGSWSADIAMNINGNANTANSAGTANRAMVADSCTGNSATATTASACTGNSATATKLAVSRKINETSFDGTKDISINVGVKTVNGNAPSDNGNVDVAGVPVGFEYISFNPNIPTGSLPLLGGTFSRTAYADLWAWVQSQTGYLISEAEWQERSASNGGNVSRYSDGDGSTTFRVPSLKCWVKGASGIEEVGSYLQAGLPNITGSFNANNGDKVGEATYFQAKGAFVYNGNATYTGSAGYAGVGGNIGFDASMSDPIYGNSDTVQPPSVAGMYLVKAFGTVSNVGNQDIADISAGLTSVEDRLSQLIHIVESYENGADWYRVWSDGRVEQGGYLIATHNDQIATVTLLKPYTDDTYRVSITFEYDATGPASWQYLCPRRKTTSSFVFSLYKSDSTGTSWYACGKGAVQRSV